MYAEGKYCQDKAICELCPPLPAKFSALSLQKEVCEDLPSSFSSNQKFSSWRHWNTPSSRSRDAKDPNSGAQKTRYLANLAPDCSDLVGRVTGFLPYTGNYVSTQCPFWELVSVSPSQSRISAQFTYLLVLSQGLRGGLVSASQSLGSCP